MFFCAQAVMSVSILLLSVIVDGMFHYKECEEGTTLMTMGLLDVCHEIVLPFTIVIGR